jgi:hypothetical protein
MTSVADEQRTNVGRGTRLHTPLARTHVQNEDSQTLSLQVFAQARPTSVHRAGHTVSVTRR